MPTFVTNGWLTDLPEHQIEVRSGKVEGYFCGCSCGWRAPERESYSKGLEDAALHRWTVVGEVET